MFLTKFDVWNIFLISIGEEGGEFSWRLSGGAACFWLCFKGFRTHKMQILLEKMVCNVVGEVKRMTTVAGVGGGSGGTGS